MYQTSLAILTVQVSQAEEEEQLRVDSIKEQEGFLVQAKRAAALARWRRLQVLQQTAMHLMSFPCSFRCFQNVFTHIFTSRSVAKDAIWNPADLVCSASEPNIVDADCTHAHLITGHC